MKYIKLVILIFLVCFILASCKKSSDIVSIAPDYPVTVNGATVSRCPQRVISLSPMVTEIIYALGSNDRLVGVSDYCDYPDASSLPHLGTALNPKLDDIIKLNPEVVIASENMPKEALDRLGLRSIPLVIINGATDLKGMNQLYINVATVMSGKHSGQTNANDTYNKIINKITETGNKTKNAAKPKAALILSYNNAVATGDSIASYLLENAGAENVAAKGKDFTFSNAQIAAANPDYIFCSSEDLAKIKADKDLSATNAVKNGKVIAADIKALERLGKKITNVNELMAKSMHPELFSATTSAFTNETQTANTTVSSIK